MLGLSFSASMMNPAPGRISRAKSRATVIHAGPRHKGSPLSLCLAHELGWWLLCPGCRGRLLPFRYLVLDAHSNSVPRCPGDRNRVGNMRQRVRRPRRRGMRGDGVRIVREE